MILCNSLSSLSLYFKNAICNPLIFYSTLSFDSTRIFCVLLVSCQLQLGGFFFFFIISLLLYFSFAFSLSLHLHLLFHSNSIILLVCFMLLFNWLLRDQLYTKYKKRDEKKKKKTRTRHREESSENKCELNVKAKLCRARDKSNQQYNILIFMNMKSARREMPIHWCAPKKLKRL